MKMEPSASCSASFYGDGDSDEIEQKQNECEDDTIAPMSVAARRYNTRLKSTIVPMGYLKKHTKCAACQHKRHEPVVVPVFRWPALLVENRKGVIKLLAILCKV
jgi:hypothetical protein